MMIAPKKDVLFTSNVPSDNTQNYNAATTYSKNEEVQHNDIIWLCLADGTVNIEPGTTPVIWYPQRPSNKTAMFDGFNDTTTKHNGDIVVSGNYVDLDVIALFGVYADAVNIVIEDLDTSIIVYHKTIPMKYYDVSDMWEWTYPRADHIPSMFRSLPMIHNARITVTIQNDNGVAECSNLAMGRTESLGCTQWGASISGQSNTRRDRNRAGRVYLEKGNGWDKMSVPVKIDTKLAGSIKRKLKKIDGVPTIFIGDENEEGIDGMLVYGFYRDFSIPITLTKSLYTLDIEGVG